MTLRKMTLRKMTSMRRKMKKPKAKKTELSSLPRHARGAFQFYVIPAEASAQSWDLGGTCGTRSRIGYRRPG
jgi:hypothetical protein